MPTPPTANGVRVELIFQMGVHRMENVYHVTRGTPATLAQLTALWTTFRNWHDSWGRTLQHTSCQLVLISITALDGPGAPFHEAQVSPALVGLQVAAPMPTYVSFAVKHSTGKQGRSYRGRTYVCGLANSWGALPDGTTPANAATIANVWNTLRTAYLVPAGWTFSVLSLYSGVDDDGKAIPRAAGILTPVTGSSCEVNYDTQRHRKAPFVV